MSVILPRRARIMTVQESHGPFGKIEFQWSRAESGVTA
jgi:hypothetical protein